MQQDPNIFHFSVKELSNILQNSNTTAFCSMYKKHIANITGINTYWSQRLFKLVDQTNQERIKVTLFWTLLEVKNHWKSCMKLLGVPLDENMHVCGGSSLGSRR